MDAYRDFCRDCCVRGLLNHLHAVRLDLLILDELSKIEKVSIALKLIDSISLEYRFQEFWPISKLLFWSILL